MTATVNAAGASAPAGASAQYYLQDSRGNTGDNLMFWAAAGGYTSSLDKAELFSEDKVFSMHTSRPSDVPWPADYVKARTRPVVDMQYLVVDEAHMAPYDTCEQFCVQVRGWVGNDILMIAKDGDKPVSNLNLARVFERSELFGANGMPLMNGAIWPVSYLQAKSRLAVDCSLVDIKKALKGVDRVLVKERKYVQRYRCEGCGVFLSMQNYYADCCQRCGFDNRP